MKISGLVVAVIFWGLTVHPCGATNLRLETGLAFGIGQSDLGEGWDAGWTWGLGAQYLLPKYGRIYTRYTASRHPANDKSYGGDYNVTTYTAGLQGCWKTVVFTLGTGYGRAPSWFHSNAFNDIYQGSWIDSWGSGPVLDVGFGFEFRRDKRLTWGFDLIRIQRIYFTNGFPANNEMNPLVTLSYRL